MSAQRTAKAGRSVYVPPNARGSGSSRQVYQDTPQATVARSSENDSTTRDHKTRTVEARPTGRRGKAGHSRRARGSMDNAADETGLSSTGTIVSTPLRKQDEAEIVERPVEPEKHLEKPTDTRTLSRSSSRDRPKNERKGSPVEPDCGKFERQCDLQASVGHAQAPVSSAIHIVSSNNNPTTGYREAVRISLNDGPHNRREPRKARSQYVPPGRRGEDDRGYGEENARHIAALSHDVSGVAKSLGSTAQSSSATDDALIAAEDAAGVSPDADESLSSPKLQSCQETATKAARMKEERTSSKGIISLRETQTRVQQDPYVSPTIHEGEDFKSEHRLGLGNQGGVESDAGPVAARVACPRDRTEEVSAAAHLGSDAEAAFLLSEAATEANAVAVGGSTAEQNSVEIVDLRAESVADTGVATVGGRCSRSVHTGTTCATESWSKSDFTDAVTDFTDAVTAETVGARDRQRDVHDSTVASGTEGNSPRGEDQSESTLTALVDTTEIFTKVSPFKTVSAPYIPPGRRKMMEAAPQTAPEATGGDAMGGSTGIGPLWTFRAPVRVSQRARPTDGESSPSRPPPSRVAAVVSGGMSAYGANIEEYSEQMSRGQVEACTALITNFPTSLPPGQPESMLHPFTENGALIVWPRPDEALATFATPTLARQAISAKIIRSSVLRVELLSNAREEQRRRFQQVELTRPGRPPADVSSASRLISGALGMRRPREWRPGASTTRNTSATDASRTGRVRGRGARQREPEESTDSWDM